MWIVCKFILLDFRLQVFGFGSPRTWAQPMATFAFQLLLLWFVARGRGGVWIFPRLQKALVPLLVLPVCEDLGSSGEDRKYERTCGFTQRCGHGDDPLLPVSAPPRLLAGGWLRIEASPAPAAGCPAPRFQCHHPRTSQERPCTGDTTSHAPRV